MSKEPIFSQTTESVFQQLPEVLREADREQVFPLEIKEVKEAFNYIPNSSAEASAPGMEVGRNLFIDPSFEQDIARTALRARNLVRNPHGVTLDGTVAVRRNLAYVSNVVGENGVVVVPGTPFGGLTDWLSIYQNTIGNSVIIRADLAELETQKEYTVSVEVANPNNAPISLAFRWCSKATVYYTLAAKERRIISATGTELLYLDGKRGGYLSSEDGEMFLVRQPMIEAAGVYISYFDGSTWAGDTDLTPTWEGTAGESPSALMAPKPKGWSATGGVVYWSVSKQKALLFAPYVGETTAHAECSDGEGFLFPGYAVPRTAMARVISKDKKWKANYDGAWPPSLFTEVVENEVSSLQYPVLDGGTVPPNGISTVGSFWQAGNGTVYRRVK